ncbi:hypothetical protein ACFQDZ_23380 [Sulfitobacter pacificus]
MDDVDLTIDIPEELFAILAQRAEEKQRTPDEEARAILITALKSKQDTPS